MRTKPERHGAQLALATIAATLAFLAAGVGGAAAAPAASASPSSQCWLDVINDWLRDNRVDKTYAIPCYTQAIQRLNSYPDVQNYSNAADDIHRALLAAIRQDRGSGPGSGSALPPGQDGGGGGGGAPGTTGGGGKKSQGGIFRRIASTLAPSSAQSVPLPLLVLGGLAFLLLVAAGATWLARRIQAKRPPQRPVPQPAVPKRR